MTENIEIREDNELIKTTIITGLVGGMFFVAIGFLASYFKMSDVHPNVILTPFFTGKWVNTWVGFFFTLFIYGLISIGVAFLYYLLLRRQASIWIGVSFGGILFLITFLCLPLILPGVDTLRELTGKTIITVSCLYISYGTFIGYSISYEALQTSYNKPEEAK